MRFLSGIAACAVALLVFASSASAAGEFEPNDTPDTAYGPLSGGTDYTATFETNNDVDWYVFYLKAYSQMDFSATLIAGCGSIHIELRDKDGKELQLFHSAGLNEVEHLRTTLAAGRYYFAMTTHGCVGDVYRFRIDPAAVVTSNRECGEAIVAKEAVGPQLAKVAGELAKNSERLAKPSSEVTADEARLAAVDQRREKFLAQWKAAVRKLSRRYGIPGYVRRQKMRSLLATKRRTNLRLKSMKDSAQRDLAVDQKAQAPLLEQRAGLQAVESQAKGTQSQAEAQIAAHC